MIPYFFNQKIGEKLQNPDYSSHKYNDFGKRQRKEILMNWFEQSREKTKNVTL